MTAVENESTIRNTLFRDGGVVSPEAASDQSRVKNVIGLLQDYVPQAVSGSKEVEKKERVLWAEFETGDVNDVTLPHMVADNQIGGQDTERATPPILLTLGFSNGFSIWMIPPDGDATEMFCCCGDDETARTARILRSPETGMGVAPDAYVAKRPILAVVKRGRCDESSAAYSTLHLISLRAGEDSWGKPFKKYSFKLRPIMDVKCNRRIVAIVLQKRIVVLDAGSLEYRFIIKNDYPSASFPCNPIALGPRWLAYSETKLSSKHQSIGGMSRAITSSVATTMLKSVKKGITALSDTISGLRTKAQSSGAAVVYEKNTEEVQISYANIITVLDVTHKFQEKFELKLQDTDRDCAAVVAHFVAHAGPDVHIAALQFNPSGNLLLSASTEGHTFHVFQLLSHPLLSSETAVHHLYTLYRGATHGVVQDVAFSLDSRWVVVSTLNGTSHAFPIAPYGGEPTVRTHTSTKVVNRMSRFQTSAGMDSMVMNHHGNGGSTSKSGQSHSQAPPPVGVPSSQFASSLNGYNTWSSPRCLPLPNPVSVSALQQIKQPYQSLQAIAGMSGTFSGSGASGNPGGGGGVGSGGTSGTRVGVSGRSKVSGGVASGESDVSLVGADGVCVRAMFRCVDTQHNAISGGEDSGASYSLYILGANGVLTKHCLLPRKLDSAPEGDDAPISLHQHPQIQWKLMGTPPAVSPGYTPLPLTADHPLIKANDAYLKSVASKGAQQQHASDKQPNCLNKQPLPPSPSSTVWLSQVEILTHAPPSRRLWMGPQFSFKTCHRLPLGLCRSPSGHNVHLPPATTANLIKTPSPPNTIIYSGSLTSTSCPSHLGSMTTPLRQSELVDNSSEGTAVLSPNVDTSLLDLDSPDFQSLKAKPLDQPVSAAAGRGPGVVYMQDYHDTGMVEVCGSWNKLAPTFEGSPSFTGDVERQLEDAMGELDIQNVTVASSRVRTGFSPP